MRKLVLASSSPRRKALLQSLGIDYTVEHSSFQETAVKNKSPKNHVQGNALGKAQTVARNHNDALIIGADTVVVYQGMIMGKPKDLKDAVAMLSMLQGNAHDVYTGLAVIDTWSNKTIANYEKTRVIMRALTPKEINSYLKCINPLDKAGAYAIQKYGSLIIEKISGCYYNVVGFPIAKLEEMLLSIGVTLFDYMNTK
jgi:septum formation protein